MGDVAVVTPCRCAGSPIRIKTIHLVWCRSWPGLLDVDYRRFYGTGSADGAGFGLNRSGAVVGVSNVFAGSADLVTVWSDLIVVVARTYPGFDLVGYELGTDLQAALGAGFACIGPLRVWMR
jgi:hypothetical protein